MKASPTKRCRKEPEYTFAEAAWRRAVLRLMVLMANAAQRVVMKFMGVRHPREQLQVQLLEVIRGLDDDGLTTARQMLEDAGRARNNDPGSEEWSMVDEMEVAEPVEPRKRRVPETEEQYPNYPGLGPPRTAKNLCYCNLEVETIRTKKLGPNVHRLFVRCPWWRDPGRRCPFFHWLPDEQQDMWASNTPSFLKSPSKSPSEKPASSHARNKYKASPSESDSSTNRSTAASSATTACLHKNVTYAGSNGWVKMTKCRDCGEVLRREATTAAHVGYRGLDAVAAQQAPPAARKGPPPPQPVNGSENPGTPLSPTTPASSMASYRPRLRNNEPDSEEIEEFEEFQRFRAMRAASKRNK